MPYSKWVKINDFIEVSNFGEVKSHGKIIKGEITSGGYCRVHISHKGVQYKFLVHRLVAEAFILNPKHLPEVNHIDGNKQNNSVDNLEWCNRSHNIQHAYDNFLHTSGEDCNLHKLSWDDVDYIRKHYKPYDKEFGQKALAEKFNVDRTTIWYILNNKTWNHKEVM